MWRILLSDIDFDQAERNAVMQVLGSRWLTMGPKTEEFESATAAKLGCQYAVAVSSCTAALQIAYEWFSGEAGGEYRSVVVPDITFVATANAAHHGGLTPVLADIENQRSPFLGIKGVESLEREETGPLGGAAVHYAGFDGGIKDLYKSCKEQGRFLIEDAAHAIGGKTDDGSAFLGTVGDAGCFSFFSNKNLVTGEGGMLVTNNADLADFARLARSHGVTRPTWQRHQKGVAGGYDVVMRGHNFRCTEITAAIGIEQLKKLDEGNAKRRKLFRQYTAAFAQAGLEGIALRGGALENGACHIFPLLCENADQRERVAAALAGAGIQTSHHYRPLHSFEIHQGEFAADAFENAQRFAERQITLPLYPGLSDENQQEVIRTVLSVL